MEKVAFSGCQLHVSGNPALALFRAGQIAPFSAAFATSPIGL
jgi:hypothetical protein